MTDIQAYRDVLEAIRLLSRTSMRCSGNVLDVHQLRKIMEDIREWMEQDK